MELKKYQKDVIDDLSRFLALIVEGRSVTQAYKAFWEEKHVPVGFKGMEPYNSVLGNDIPDVCIKVPTGGGKTFIACNAIKPIFDALPHTKTKAVVWLVPSDSIYEQTKKALSDSHHPYRQKINVHFGNRVEVYTKQQLLSGQNFNPTTINEQLSIFVLSYDSFRTSQKDGRKAFQENGSLAAFAKFFNNPDILLADTDETALIQVIRSLCPILIVDESHHAISDLSIEMLQNFNPYFVLDLTATPKKSSNIISYVDARQLKSENMVKLPVIVYNRPKQDDVYLDAIHMRNRLETEAKQEQANGGNYIRPIVLFQAQPKGKEDSATFQKLKKILVDIGIPEIQIAIKTADVNELKNIDLISEDCSIRYIITVNALKEGWDCPFAYILATVANRTSSVDVEQILGRVLRLPYTRQNTSKVLNYSYVITSSSDFQTTLDKVIKGLNSAGFSDKDYRAKDIDDGLLPTIPDFSSQQPALFENVPKNDDIPEIDTSAIRDELAQKHPPAIYAINEDHLFADAMEKGETYEAILSQAKITDVLSAPLEVREKMNVFHINTEWKEEIKSLKLPQFFVDAPLSMFDENKDALLHPANLAEGFTLKDKDADIDFDTLDADMVQVDIENSSNATPKTLKITGLDHIYFKKWFDSQPPEHRLEICKDIICKHSSKIDAVSDQELQAYVSRIVANMTAEQRADMEQTPNSYAIKIKDKVINLLTTHAEKIFTRWVNQNQIRCKPHYMLKSTISPTQFTSKLPKSLYTSEEELNKWEHTVVWGFYHCPI